MGYISNVNINGEIHLIEPLLYYNCSSAADAPIKFIANSSNLTLVDGLIFYVEFTFGNTSITPKLKFSDSINGAEYAVTLGQLKQASIVSFIYKSGTIRKIDPINLLIDNNNHTQADKILSIDTNNNYTYCTQADLKNFLGINNLGNTYKQKQDAQTLTIDSNTFISGLKQSADGVISITGTQALDTRGPWLGNAATATTAEQLSQFVQIFGHVFNGTQSIINNLKLTPDNTSVDLISSLNDINGQIRVVKKTGNNPTTQLEFIQYHTSGGNPCQETYILDNSNASAPSTYSIITTNTTSVAKLDVSQQVKGILPLQNGGTGASTNEFVENQIIYKNIDGGIHKLTSSNQIYVDKTHLYVGYGKDQNVEYRTDYDFQVDGLSYLNGNTKIDGNTQINGEVTIGTENNTKTIQLYGALNVTGNSTLQKLETLNTATLYSLIVQTTTNLYGDVTIGNSTNTQPTTIIKGLLKAQNNIEVYKSLEFYSQDADPSIAAEAKTNKQNDIQWFEFIPKSDNILGYIGRTSQRWEKLYIHDVNIGVDGKNWDIYMDSTNDGSIFTIKPNDNNTNIYLKGFNINNPSTSNSGFYISPRLAINTTIDTNYNLLVSGPSMFNNAVGIGTAPSTESDGYLIVRNMIRLVNNNSINSSTANWYLKVSAATNENNNNESKLSIFGGNLTELCGFTGDKNGFELKTYLYINDTIPNTDKYHLLVNGISYFKDKVGIGTEIDSRRGSSNSNALLTINKYFKLVSDENNQNDIIHFNCATITNTIVGQIYPHTDMNGYLGLTTNRWNSLNLFNSMKIDGSIRDSYGNIHIMKYLEAKVENDLSLKLFYDGNNDSSNNKKQQGLLNLHVAPNTASIALRASCPFIELTHDIENNSIISNNWKIINDNNIFTICHDANVDANNKPIATTTHLKAYRGIDSNGIINDIYGIEIQPRLIIGEELSTAITIKDKDNVAINPTLYVTGQSYFKEAIHITGIPAVAGENGTAGAAGKLILYNKGIKTKHTTIESATTDSDNTFYIPPYNNDLYAVHTGSTDAVGQTVTDRSITSVYVDKNGRVTPMQYPTNRLMYGVCNEDNKYKASKHYIHDSILGINLETSANQQNYLNEGNDSFASNSIFNGATLAVNGSIYTNNHLLLINNGATNAAQNREIQFWASGAKYVGIIRFNYPINSNNTATNTGNFQFYQYNVDNGCAIFQLPVCTMDAIQTYNIFTGYNKTANRLLYTITDENNLVQATTGHYANDTQIAINRTSAPPSDDIKLYVNGQTEITSTLFLTKITTADETAAATFSSKSTTPLVIGNVAGQHIAISNNTIISKSGTTAGGTLYLNRTGTSTQAGGNVEMCHTMATNYVKIWSTKASTDSTTGALVVNGGIGIAGAVYTNNLLQVKNNITSTTGNIAATAGNVTAGKAIIAGSTITANGNITSTTGSITATAGSITAGTSITAKNNITSTNGHLETTEGHVLAGTYVKAGTYMNAETYIIAHDQTPFRTEVSGVSYIDISFKTTAGITSSGDTRYRTVNNSSDKPDLQGLIRLYINQRTYSASGETLTASGFGTTRFRFYQYSRNAAASGNLGAQTTGKCEVYQLPQTTVSLASSKTYDILTTKDTISIEQGGTNATSFATDNRLIQYNGTKLVTTTGLGWIQGNSPELNFYSPQIDVTKDDNDITATRYERIYFNDKNERTFAQIQAYGLTGGNTSIGIGIANWDKTAATPALGSMSTLVLAKTKNNTATCTFGASLQVIINNTTDASSTTNGGTVIKGGLSIAKKIYCGSTITGTQVFNAVWNDYAECRTANTEEPGYCVTETDNGIMVKTTQRLEAGCKITSDTYGTCMGETENAKTPIAVAGRVLAYPYRARQEYPLGAAVCSAPNGTVDIMTRDEIMMYPERIIGTVSEIPTYEIWHGGSKENPSDIKVNGRIWIYVR